MHAPRLVTLPPLLLTGMSASEWLQRISSQLHRLSDTHRRLRINPAQSHQHQQQTQAATHPADIDEDIRNAVLYIDVVGPLDLRCIFRMLAIVRAIDQPLIASRINLEGVTRIFDSGIAALIILVRALTEKGIGWIYVDDIGSCLAGCTDRLDQRLRLTAFGQIGDGTGSAHGISDGLIEMHG